MKIIVIYNSQTGFTKRYAEWIAEATGADCLALSAAKAKNLADYDSIIFGGWACAGNISCLTLLFLFFITLSTVLGQLEYWTGRILIGISNFLLLFILHLFISGLTFQIFYSCIQL